MKINKFFNLKSLVELLCSADVRGKGMRHFMGTSQFYNALLQTTFCSVCFCQFNVDFFPPFESFIVRIVTIHDMKVEFVRCSFLWLSFSNCFHSQALVLTSLSTPNKSPYINHLMEKLMHMTVDSATNSSVGMADSILVGDDKSHFDRWNVKKLLFLLP